MIQHLVQKNQAGKVKFITLTLSGDTLSREWGILDGKTQTTSNTFAGKNIGKKNEQTPEQVAQAKFDKLLKDKCKEGYVKTDSLDDIPDLSDGLDDIDLDNIPTAFCASKPTRTISDKALDKLLASGNGRLHIKYNGQCHFILINSEKQIKIFTRRWEDHTIKYPSIVEAVREEDYPASTLIMAELHVDPAAVGSHMEGFLKMSKISKTEVTKGKCKPHQIQSLALQEKYPVIAAVLTFLYYGGDDTWTLPYGQIEDLIAKLVSPRLMGEKLFRALAVPFTTAAAARKFVKDNKDRVEGLVAWDLTQAMQITLNGKPNRCAAWKVKEDGDMDVIAWSWVEGTGKLQGKIGSICIGKFDAEGDWVDLGTVGSGLKPEKGDCEPESWTFPCVVEIKYDQIFPDTEKFQFPRYSKKHEDKLPEDLGWPGKKAA